MVERSGSLNVETVMQKEHSEQRNKAATAMKTHIKNNKPEKHNEYMELQTNQQRHEWLIEYMLDPKVGGELSGSNFTERTETARDKMVQIWLTEDELAGPSYLNSENKKRQHR